MNEEIKTNHQVIRLEHRLKSQNPRVIEYRLSDRPDEIFLDTESLLQHRGFTKEQSEQIVKNNNLWAAECCATPRGFVGGTCDYCGGVVQPEKTE